MRKLLLATSALVAFAGAAQAAESPITVNVGGYVDFRAGQFHESTNNTTGGLTRRDYDFETEYRLNIAAEGKAANGMEYGGLISLWNGAEYNDAAGSFTGGSNTVREDQAYVWMSGAWGKAVLGDDHGASDLFVYAPTVGEGQIDGTYTDFTDPATLTVFQASYIDNTENSTKVTYYTPKVGNENNKVQLGASFTPSFYGNGQLVNKYKTSTAGVTSTTGTSAYQDYVEATAQYTGNFAPVATVLSATMSTGARNGESASGTAASLRDFTSWGLGGQFMFAGFTFGGSYVDAGRYGTVEGQNKAQDSFTIGAKYEFDKVALAINGLEGRGYNNGFRVNGNGLGGAAFTGLNSTDHTNYVKDFKALGLGATYTWFPGLTTAADAVMFRQNRADNIGGVAADKDDGHVVMITQKITF